MSEEELELFENIYDLGIGECPTDDIEQAGLIFDKFKNIIEENKELKEKYSKLEDKYIKNLPCCNEEDCSLYSHAINTDYILTEFEKWLEEQKENDLNENFIVVRLVDIKNKLQELKNKKID